MSSKSKSGKRGRGRPAVYVGNVKKHIVGLIRRFRASGAMEILRADANSSDPEVVALAQKRNLKLVPTALTICMPRLLAYAKEAGVKLQRGRPATKKVAAKKEAAAAAAA